MAAARSEGWGYEVEVRKGGDGINWLALAQHQTVPNEAGISEARSQLEELALKLQGEYDGWESQVRNQSYSPYGTL